MEFKPQIKQLKTGCSVRIRIPRIVNAQHLLDLKRSYIRNTSTLPMTLDEYSNDVEKEEKLIIKYTESSNSILLVADINNELVGNIDLTGSDRSKMSHTAMLGIGISEKWRNQGLGRLLIESVINWARNHTEIEIIWLDVYASNELGYNLYKNTGFELSGIIPDFSKEGNTYINKIQMFQRIK